MERTPIFIIPFSLSMPTCMIMRKKIQIKTHVHILKMPNNVLTTKKIHN